MDAESSPSPSPSASRTPRPAQGGIAESAHRASPAIRDFQTTREWPGVWLDASARGVKRELQARQVKRITPARDTQGTTASNAAENSSPPRVGRKTVVAAIEALLVAMRVPEARRLAVLDAATEQLAQRTRSGQTHKVKVYDAAAQPLGPVNVPVPGPEISRAREPVAPTHAR